MALTYFISLIPKLKSNSVQKRTVHQGEILIQRNGLMSLMRFSSPTRPMGCVDFEVRFEMSETLSGEESQSFEV